jgi:LPS O-antigen subunit length determinant protein (WzzB/FepE family)
LSVSSDKKSGLVSVSIEYYSPLAAKQWVDLFVVTINEHMRDRKLAQVNNNIQYLEAQIEKTAIADMREVFYQIIEEQIKNKMLAEASPEYAFTTVSRAMLPEEKSKPKRALICILGTLLGGMLSVLAVLIRHYSRKP